MGRRNDHSREEQREMAIAAAELLLVREGLAGFSMRKVARAIGYTAGQLYLLFKNQDELFVILNERTAEAIYAALRDEVDERDGVEARLRAAAHAYIGFAQQHPNRWRLMFEHRLPDGVEAPRGNVLRVQRLFELVQGIVRPLKGDWDDGELVDVATALWSGVHGICVLAVSGKLVWSGQQDYGRLCDILIGNMLAGLVAPA